MALLRGDRHPEAPILVNWRACVTTRCPVRLGDGNPRAPPERGWLHATGAALGVEPVRSAAPVLDAVVMLVDNAVYVNGLRTADPQSLEETC